MSDPYVIRLRGPWEFVPLARASGEGPDDLPDAGKVQMPEGWRAGLAGGFQGRVRYLRRFGCPTGLGPQDRVWLVVNGLDASASVRLNDRELEATQHGGMPLRTEVTRLLETRNVLTIDVDVVPASDHAEAAYAEASGPIGDVRLEIESSDD